LALPVNPALKQDIKLMAWLVADFREHVLDKSVGLKEATDVLCSVLATGKSADYIYNAHFEKLGRATYDAASDINDDRQTALDKEWKAKDVSKTAKK
jgi:hypothetical protein